MRDKASFWNRTAAKYALQPIANEAAYQHKVQITASYLQPSMRVLELGCGTGSTALLHAPRVASILATDVSSKMLAIAQQKAAQAQVQNIEFRCAAVEDLLLPPASFEVVMAHSLLHLLEDKEAVLAKAYDTLTPGGYLITSTPCLADWLNWFRYIAPLGQALGLLPLVRFFGQAELLKSIEQAGFVLQYQWQPENDPRAAVFMVARKL